jgi:hypothetical protein
MYVIIDLILAGIMGICGTAAVAFIYYNLKDLGLGRERLSDVLNELFINAIRYWPMVVTFLVISFFSFYV